MPRTANNHPRPTARELLAANLQRLRAEIDISQYELSKRSGVDRSFIAHVERQARNVSIDIITKLAIALNVPVAELFAEFDGKVGKSER
jgi:transcriptional regulator with XRE-family HTH domain